MKQILIYDFSLLKVIVSVFIIAIVYVDVLLTGIFSRPYEWIESKLSEESLLAYFLSCPQCISIWLMIFYVGLSFEFVVEISYIYETLAIVFSPAFLITQYRKL